VKSTAPPIEKIEAIYREWEAKPDLVADIERHLDERKRYLRLLEIALSTLPAGARVLELGCGSGIDSCILSRRYPNIMFYGVDIARGSLSLVRRVSDQMKEPIHLAMGDVFRLPFRSQSISLVFHQGLVEHFPDPEGMMREQDRILTPGGWAVISVPQTFTGYTLMKRRQIKKGVWPWGWECSYSASGLESLARTAGLKPVERCGEGYWRSWEEPAWVFRDLYGKFQRRIPLARRGPFQAFERLWEGAWERLENGLGHLFCKNVIVLFQKRAAAEQQ
jgi:ubiquinone/menaquinone biosynthesis C-methylase UbiE